MSLISVVTLAKGRPDHLRNLVLGLQRQTIPPHELIVAVMQELTYDLPDTSFAVRQIVVPGEELPLAAARNAAATAATGELLVFLDMDCIPTPSLLADYAARMADVDGLLMGEVLYLPDGATAGDWRYGDFATLAVRHSERQGPPVVAIEHCSDYRCFWSLNFAMRRATFHRSGGFDERFRGYGGEDTDFGKTIQQAGIPIAWIRGGLAYHQYHPHYMPPVHHMDSVVRNAELFASKWGYRTMDHWLRAFRLMGLIEDRNMDPIRILRRPGPADFALTAQQRHEAYASSAAVIRQLEMQANQVVEDPAAA